MAGRVGVLRRVGGSNRRWGTFEEAGSVAAMERVVRCVVARLRVSEIQGFEARGRRVKGAD